MQVYITSLGSDANKIGSAIRQIGGLKTLAFNALERERSFRRSIRQKSRRAAMNDQYMIVGGGCLKLQPYTRLRLSIGFADALTLRNYVTKK